MKISKQFLKELRQDLIPALEEIGKKHGVQITYEGGNYTDTNAVIKIQIAVLDESGEALTREAENFRLNAQRFGLKPEYLNMTFKVRGTEFQVIGLNTRSRKYPIILRNSSGEIRRAPASTVALYLG